VYLKPLLAHGIDRFFHIGPAFRKSERGHLHATEFTILEWYRAFSDFNLLILDCIDLLSSVFKEFSNGNLPVKLSVYPENIEQNVKIFSIKEVFLTLAGWNPIEEKDERRFERDLVEKIEPALAKYPVTILKDYPSWAASLARICEKDKRICERFELYLQGIELANGFSELLDPLEQKLRFQEENKKRISLGHPPIEMPEGFLSALDRCPPSAGIAMGVDRLLMIILRVDHIDRLIPPFNI